MNKFKQIRQLKGMTQSELAEGLKISALAVSQYETGRRFPNAGILERYMDYFNLPRSFFYDEHQELMPHFGSVSAGPGVWTNGYPQRYVTVPEEFRCHGEYFVVEASGDSMEPEIHNGDTLIVRRQNYINRAGQIAVVSVGEDGRVKKVYYTQRGIKLVSVNPKYPPDEYMAGENVHVHGIVAGMFRVIDS